MTQPANKRLVTEAAQATALAGKQSAAALDSDTAALWNDTGSAFRTAADADLADKVSATAPSYAATQALDTGDAMALRRFRAALANRNNARCNMLHIGDSITWGYKATTDGAASYAAAWTTILRDTMRARFPNSPAVAGGFGYISARQDFGSTRTDAPITHVGGAQSSTYGLDRQSRIMSSGATETVTFTGTGIDVQYLKWPGGGTFSWAIDGGTATNVSTTNATQTENNTVQIRGLTAGAHTLVVSYVSGGTSFVGGYYAYNGDESKGIGSWMLAFPSVMSSYWSDTTASKWANGLPWATPDLVTIELGANDYNQSSYVPSATFRANIETLIATIKSVLTYSPSFVLVPVWELVKAGNPEAWQAYVDAMYAIAAADAANVCVFDAAKRVRVGSPGNTAGGLLGAGDGAHLSPQGNRYLAESLATFIGPR